MCYLWPAPACPRPSPRRLPFLYEARFLQSPPRGSSKAVRRPSTSQYSRKEQIKYTPPRPGALVTSSHGAARDHGSRDARTAAGGRRGDASRMCATAGMCDCGGEGAPGRCYHPLPSRVPGGACDLLSTGEDRGGWRPC